MIHKVYDENYNFYKLTCDEGEVISSWNEGDDILNYDSFSIAYCPFNADLDIYHTFTNEQHIQFRDARDAAFRAKEQNENNA